MFVWIHKTRNSDRFFAIAVMYGVETENTVKRDGCDDEMLRATDRTPATQNTWIVDNVGSHCNKSIHAY